MYQNNTPRCMICNKRTVSLTCVANSGVVDLDSDFARLWWSYLDVFDGEVLAGFPSDGSLLLFSN